MGRRPVEPDGTRLAFVSTSRDHKQEKLRIADATTGAVRDVLEEKVPTFFESGNGRVNWHYLPASNEVIWFSERDNWGHLYLYDSETGKLKNQITTGEGNVTQMLRVDEKNRHALLPRRRAARKGRDPYFIHFYRVGFDGKNLTLLTPDDGNHDVTLSPSGKYFVDSYSKPDVPPVAVLRDADGKLVTPLEKADISKLLATGWKPPTSHHREGARRRHRSLRPDVQAHQFRSDRRSIPSSTTSIPARRPAASAAAISRPRAAMPGAGRARLHRGRRSTAWARPGAPRNSTRPTSATWATTRCPTRSTGMKQLAQRYPWIDIDRAGIYGHSGGGYATADAMFRYPDFFKVGISEAGNHDNRDYEDDWAEKWQGLLEDESRRHHQLRQPGQSDFSPRI